VANGGTIRGTGGSGVVLHDGGRVVNQSGGLISGAGGGSGVALQAGGSVQNSGSISGLGGVVIGFGIGAVTNSGTIDGGSAIGVELDLASGSVDNEAGGLISGTASGVAFFNGSTITNFGTISSSNEGVTIGFAGQVFNYGLISGDNSDGVGIEGGSGQVTNAGEIRSVLGDGVLLSAGTVTNSPSGAFAFPIIQGSSTGVRSLTGAVTVTNLGRITGIGQGGVGVSLGTGGGIVTNGQSGSAVGYISGLSDGVFSEVTGGTIVNWGTIVGSQDGVYSGGAATTATITNSGTIMGGGNGVDGSGMVSNLGIIRAVDPGGDGVHFSNHGDTNASAGSVENSGSIVGTSIGVFLQGKGVVTNEGEGTIKGTGAESYGVKAGAAARSPIRAL
jgi:hypothetical protein